MDMVLSLSFLYILGRLLFIYYYYFGRKEMFDLEKAVLNETLLFNKQIIVNNIINMCRIFGAPYNLQV